MNRHFNAIMISFTATMFLVLVFYVASGANSQSYQENAKDAFSAYQKGKMPETAYYDDYEELRAPPKTLVVFPIFTQSAYEWGGIHDFYVGRCDSCLTVEIQNFYDKLYSASGNGFRILEFLDYEIIDDTDLDKNPGILKQFERVILLHNEFVSRNEFNAITQHPRVVYLYPNALSSEVEVDYHTNTITLIRGPGYPDKTISNGFDWEFDNTEYFYDWDCIDWKFYKIDNGHMLNCYPEKYLPNEGFELLKTIKTL